MQFGILSEDSIIGFLKRIERIFDYGKSQSGSASVGQQPRGSQIEINCNRDFDSSIMDDLPNTEQMDGLVELLGDNGIRFRVSTEGNKYQITTEIKTNPILPRAEFVNYEDKKTGLFRRKDRVPVLKSYADIFGDQQLYFIESSDISGPKIAVKVKGSSQHYDVGDTGKFLVDLVREAKKVETVVNKLLGIRGVDPNFKLYLGDNPREVHGTESSDVSGRTYIACQK